MSTSTPFTLAFLVFNLVKLQDSYLEYWLNKVAHLAKQPIIYLVGTHEDQFQKLSIENQQEILMNGMK